MRWRPGSGDRQPWKRKKLLEISGVPNRSRIRTFVYNRLWVGVLPAIVVGFGLVLLLCLFGAGMTPGKSLFRALLAGALCGGGLILGIWGSTESEAEEGAVAGTDDLSGSKRPVRRFARWRVVLAVVFLAGVLAYSEVSRMLDGTLDVWDGISRLAMKLLTAACVIVPIWLAEKNKV